MIYIKTIFHLSSILATEITNVNCLLMLEKLIVLFLIQQLRPLCHTISKFCYSYKNSQHIYLCVFSFQKQNNTICPIYYFVFCFSHNFQVYTWSSNSLILIVAYISIIYMKYGTTFLLIGNQVVCIFFFLLLTLQDTSYAISLRYYSGVLFLQDRFSGYFHISIQKITDKNEHLNSTDARVGTV